ncbi:rhodanese-like domain-containing protein [Psychrobacter sp. HD31]|uniref:rhodanese-like domain-containing protein n=1 Tax=Psychrobacter sp. HD31 TaxID=3112003 RepID=UPI003DA46C52
MGLVSVIKNGISAMLAREPLPENAVLLDVRNHKEFAKGIVENSICIPVGELQAKQTELVQQCKLDTPIVVYCASGGRAVRAKKLLIKMGYKQVVNGGGIYHVAKKLSKPIVSC